MRRQRYLRSVRAWMRALTLLIVLCMIYPTPAISETLRLARYTAALERNAPELLYRDIIHGKSSQIRAARAFQAALNAQGWEMPHRVAPRPNTGVASGVDIDGNGQVGGPGDP